VAILLIAIWPTRYPVACTAKVEPLHQRLVCAPFEATLLEAKVRPGDSVRAGDALAILDGRPLRLELESIESERMQAAKEHDVALATGRIAEAQQFSLQRQRLSRKVDLINDRLQRLTVVSPIDGVVVSGDLDRFVGASLELGQTMIEVAPLDKMAIEIEIPEYEIGFVQSESMTRVRLNSLGGPSIRQPLTDLYPTAEIRDDRNVFVGRILVDNTELNLRPGLRGNATTYGPLRPLAWSWVRGAWERMLWWLGY
jgi:multidrug efflux pump subunit AcrA (membrane-fusion protein)